MTAGGKKKWGSCQLPLSVFGRRTHNALNICVRRLDTGKITGFLRGRLTTVPCCFEVLFVFMKKTKKQMQLIAIPGSAAQIGSSKQKSILAARREIKRNTGRKRRSLSSYSWFLHTGKEILAVEGEIKVTTMTKACIGFISTVCSCCLWLLLFSRTGKGESAP